MMISVIAVLCLVAVASAHPAKKTVNLDAKVVETIEKKGAQYALYDAKTDEIALPASIEEAIIK